jgi:hypothetical protein
MKASMKLNPVIAIMLSAALLCEIAVAETVPANAAKKATVTPAEPASHAVTLASVKTAFATGDRIGLIRSGPDCTSNTTREWSELLRRRVETDLPMVFRDELAKAKVLSITSAGSPGGTKVNAFVNDVDLQICNVGQGAWHGNIRVQVKWQVVSGVGRVIYQASTDGSFARNEAESSTSAVSGLREAFAVSVRNLLADRRFVSALRTRNERSGTVAASARR